MKKYMLLSLALLAFALVSCDDKTTNPNDDKVLFPLEVGNTWEYTVIPTGQSSETHTNKVLKDTTINNVEWSVVAYDDTLFSYMKNKSDGVYFNAKNKTSGAWTSAIYYKYKALKGDLYSNAVNVQIQVLSITDTITVPAGKFQCIRYKVIYSNELNTLEYYSPEVGLIKLIAYNADHNVAYTSMLKSYTLK